jgi:hypothetical protein
MTVIVPPAASELEVWLRVLAAQADQSLVYLAT